MKSFLFLVIFNSCLQSYAQVSKVSLQASGLTCSMCSNSIYKSLKTLSFVDKIRPDIETSTFEITFRTESYVDFNKLKVKVEDAGYSVAKFIAVIQCNNVQVKADEIVKIGMLTFKFLNIKDQVLNGLTQVKIINKGFVPVKEYKKNSSTIYIAPNVYLAAI